MKNICFLLLIFLLSCCHSAIDFNSQNSIPDSTISQRKLDSSSVHKQGELVTYSTSLNAVENYSLKIMTTYRYDTAFIAHGFLVDWDSIITEQKMCFQLNDSILKALDFVEDGKCKILIKPHKPENTLDIISGIYLIKGKNNVGAFYKIEGCGGANGGSQYTGYFSLNGNLLFESYLDHPHSIPIEVGDYKSMLANFDLNDTTEISTEINGCWVFPPQWSNESIAR